MDGKGSLSNPFAFKHHPLESAGMYIPLKSFKATSAGRNRPAQQWPFPSETSIWRMKAIEIWLQKYLESSPNSVFNTWGSYGNGKRPGG